MQLRRRLDIVSMFGRFTKNVARIRPVQQGYVYRQGNCWFIQWREDIRAADGEIRRLKFKRRLAPAAGRGKLTKREAERIAWEQILSKLNAAAVHPQSLVTVAEYWQGKFEPEWIAQLKPAGRKHYAWAKARVLAVIGKTKLRETTHEDVQQLVEQARAAGNSPQTAEHLRNAVSAMFRHAKTTGYQQGENPARGVRLPARHPHPRPTLSYEQARALLAALPAPVRQMAQLSMLTTLNVAEMLGLRWRYVNLEPAPRTVEGEILPAHSIAVRENCYRGEFGTVKSWRRRRNVPLTAGLVEMLAAWRAAARRPSDEELVFAGRTGRPLNECNLARRHLKPTARKVLGIDWVSWHVFRRSAATWAEGVHMPLSERMAMLGHSLPEMTLHYSQADIERRRGFLDTIEGNITRGGETIQ